MTERDIETQPYEIGEQGQKRFYVNGTPFTQLPAKVMIAFVQKLVRKDICEKDFLILDEMIRKEKSICIKSIRNKNEVRSKILQGHKNESGRMTALLAYNPDSECPSIAIRNLEAIKDSYSDVSRHRFIDFSLQAQSFSKPSRVYTAKEFKLAYVITATVLFYNWRLKALATCKNLLFNNRSQQYVGPTPEDIQQRKVKPPKKGGVKSAHKAAAARKYATIFAEGTVSSTMHAPAETPGTFSTVSEMQCDEPPRSKLETHDCLMAMMYYQTQNIESLEDFLTNIGRTRASAVVKSHPEIEPYVGHGTSIMTQMLQLLNKHCPTGRNRDLVVTCTLVGIEILANYVLTITVIVKATKSIKIIDNLLKTNCDPERKKEYNKLRENQVTILNMNIVHLSLTTIVCMAKIVSKAYFDELSDVVRSAFDKLFGTTPGAIHGESGEVWYDTMIRVGEDSEMFMSSVAVQTIINVVGKIMGCAFIPKEAQRFCSDHFVEVKPCRTMELPLIVIGLIHHIGLMGKSYAMGNKSFDTFLSSMSPDGLTNRGLELVEIGTKKLFVSVAKNAEDKVCLSEYMRMVDEYKDVVRTIPSRGGYGLSRFLDGSKKKPIYKEAKMKAEMYLTQCQIIIEQYKSGMRVAPVGVILYGEPECGKTKFTTLISEIAQSVDRIKEPGPQHMYNTIRDSDYEEGYKGQHTFVASELGTELPDYIKSQGDQFLIRFQTLIDGKEMPFNMPHVEDKGKVKCVSHLVIADTNTFHCNAKYSIQNSAAFFRRCAFITLKIKPEFQKDGASPSLDPKKIGIDQIMEIWDVHVTLYNSVSRDEVEISHGYSFKTVMQFSAWWAKFYYNKRKSEGDFNEVYEKVKKPYVSMYMAGDNLMHKVYQRERVPVLNDDGTIKRDKLGDPMFDYKDVLVDDFCDEDDPEDKPGFVGTVNVERIQHDGTVRPEDANPRERLMKRKGRGRFEGKATVALSGLEFLCGNGTAGPKLFTDIIDSRVDNGADSAESAIKTLEAQLAKLKKKYRPKQTKIEVDVVKEDSTLDICQTAMSFCKDISVLFLAGAAGYVLFTKMSTPVQPEARYSTVERFTHDDVNNSLLNYTILNPEVRTKEYEQIWTGPSKSGLTRLENRALSSVLDQVSKNIVRISAYHTDPTTPNGLVKNPVYGIGIMGNVVLINAHSVELLLAGYESISKRDISQIKEIPVLVERLHAGSVAKENLTIVGPSTKHVCGDGYLCTVVNRFRDISNLFPEQIMENCVDVRRIGIDNNQNLSKVVLEDQNYIFRREMSRGFVLPPHVLSSRRDKISYGADPENGFVAERFVADEKGTCGLPYIGRIDGNYYIFGIHSGGYSENGTHFAYAQCVTRKRLGVGEKPGVLEGISIEATRLSLGVSKLEPSSSPPKIHDHDYTYEETHSYEMIHCVDIPKNKDKSRIVVHNDIADKFGEIIENSWKDENGIPKFGLPNLSRYKRFGVVHNEERNWLDKQGTDVRGLCSLEIARACTDALSDYISAELKKRGISLNGIHNIDQAVNAYPMNCRFNRMNGSTSGGLPYPGSKSKYMELQDITVSEARERKMFPYDLPDNLWPSGFFYKVNDEVSSEVMWNMRCHQRGVMYHAAKASVKKDEPRPVQEYSLEDILADIFKDDKNAQVVSIDDMYLYVLVHGKHVAIPKAGSVKVKRARLFNPDAFDSGILDRMVMSGMFNLAAELNDVFMNALGINAKSPQWGELFQRLTDNDVERINRCMALDVKDFDVGTPIAIDSESHIFWYKLAKKIGCPDWMVDLVLCCCLELTTCHVVLNGVVFAVYNYLPSGCNATTQRNCVKILLCFMVCFTYLHTDLGKIYGPEVNLTTKYQVKDFFRLVRFCGLGDDSVQCPNKEIESTYNMLTVDSVGKLIGIKFTTSDKSKIDRPFDSIFDVTFLQRKFQWNDQLGIVGPLNKDSLLKMVLFTNTPRGQGQTPESVLRESFAQCLEELVVHYDQEQWEEKKRELCDLIAPKMQWSPHSLYLDSPEYSVLLEERYHLSKRSIDENLRKLCSKTTR